MKIIIYSHGFGVHKDSRGMFTDISNSISDAKHLIFDYNEIDDIKNVTTATSLDDQVKELAKVINNAKVRCPDSEIDLICHSQGRIVGAMLCSKDINKTILIAPPLELDVKRMIDRLRKREGAVIDMSSLTIIPQRDGGYTIIPSGYWASTQNIKALNLYNNLSRVTKLTIINANQDEILENTNFSGFNSGIQVINLDGNHNFINEARQVLANTIKGVLL